MSSSSFSSRGGVRGPVTLAAVLLSLAACGPTPPPVTQPPDDPTDRPRGETSFVSADGQPGQDASNGDGDVLDPGAPPEDGGGEERTVEEGDIYRVLGGGLVANLNAYRGLQLIDVSDPDAPRIVGRLQISGAPVEMYAVGDTVYVLMNHWYGYTYGGLEAVDGLVGQLDGGVALAVDISDPQAPVETGRAFIPGSIQKSRLTRQGDVAALYVVTGGWDEWQNDDGTWTWESRTVVKSFDATGGGIEPRTELNLGGYVTDIQATPERLLVARYDWSWEAEERSRVSLVDISDPNGTMVEGDEVEVEGLVESQFNLDLHHDVLRVVSGSWWGGGTTNHLQTFDASDPQHLVPIDHVTFGDNEDLFATLFLGNKAFFVTYFRTDPFHAFFIDDEGFAEEKAEFVVSGWNDFFRAVSEESRLVGIGVNDEASRTLAVSLYDITDLENPSPLVARAEVEAETSWSEANWDHRAFSVLEGATSVAGPGGVEETGLVLLPFSGWNDDWESYTAAVQIFSFSDSSLTRRGLMVHGSPVRRSFEVDDALAGNLSELELSLFGILDPDHPAERGRVELAPNYTDVLTFGDFKARVKNNSDSYSWWWGAEAELPPARVELVAGEEDPDTAPAVAAIDIPARARVFQVGDLLVVLTMTPVDSTSWPYTWSSDLDVYDLSSPETPALVGELTTDRLIPSSWGYSWDDCFDCGWSWGGYDGLDETVVAGEALVFLQRHQESESLGIEHVCSTYASENDYSCGGVVVGPDGEEVANPETCTWHYGSITCRNLPGEEPYCSGEIVACTLQPGHTDYDCAPISADDIATTTSCYDYEAWRSWQRFTLEVLDLTDPGAPALADTVTLPADDEGVGILAEGDVVHVSYRRPEVVAGDPRPYVRYFIRSVDLSVPSSPDVGDAINVPGQLVAADGNTLYTRDTLWGDDIVETAVHKLRLQGGLAWLQASHNFEDQIVYGLLLDGAGHVLASHRTAWTWWGAGDDELQMLTVLDAAGGDLAALSETAVAGWADLKGAVAGRALFQVPGGLLTLNLEDPSAPFAQAYFATRGWPREVKIDGEDILFAAGHYGIYRFDLDATNLLSAP